MKYRVRTPTRLVTREKREHMAFPSCAVCKQPMHGVPANPKGLSKSEKNPSRAYSGNMCGSCSREFFRSKARSI